MTIILTSKLAKSNAVTHAGMFHADDVFASVFLDHLLGDLKLYRVSRVPQKLKEDVIVFDIGNGEFDHHQRGCKEMRTNTIMYSSFGLLWRKFGKEYLSRFVSENEVDYVWSFIDKKLVQLVDAADCGQFPHAEKMPLLTISKIIKMFEPKWNTQEDEKDKFNKAFLKACHMANMVFENAVELAIATQKSKEFVDEAIEKCQESKLLLLERYAPWQEWVWSNPKANEMLYVIHPSPRGGYNIAVIPNGIESYVARKALPEKWAGLEGKALVDVTGIETARFCHKARFVAGAMTLEDAIALGLKAVKEPLEDS